MRALEQTVCGFPLILSRKRRTVSININRDGEVRVLAPFRAGRGYIEDFVASKLPWIEKTTLKMREKLPLNVIQIQREGAETLLRRRFELCFEVFARRFNAARPALKFRRMKTRWGSCSGGMKASKVTLNLALSGLSFELIDSVIFHELCHIIHKHHRKTFYDLLFSFVPDYQQKSRYLNQYRL